MKFTKMHGCGNDYIYFDCINNTQPQNPEALSIRLSDRHKSVGGDGVVLICPSVCADFRMRMFNADGSEGKMCGNATRCIGKYVYERGLTAKTHITLETLSGVKALDLKLDGNSVSAVTVDMGAAEITSANGRLFACDREYAYTAVSVGNPHCVIFTDGVEGMDIRTVGSVIENMTALFPDRVNTEFVELVGDNTLRMRVWERGSGETMACGTGACAAAVAAVCHHKCDKSRPVTVILNGGELEIECGETVKMTGPAEFSFDGEI